jgi:26S proteasome regulatory subunit N7
MSKETKTSKSSNVVGTADEKALLYPMMRLAQDMHRAVICKTKNDDIELEMKVFEEISIELENPFLYMYFRSRLYPDHHFPSLSGESTDVVEIGTTTTATTATSALITDAMIKSDATLSIAAKATVNDLQQMQRRNDTILQEFVDAIQVATESAGDMEVLDAHIALAQYKAKAYSKDDTIAAYETILALPKVSSGKKIDLFMSVARITSFYSDIEKTDEYLQRAMTLAEVGGGSDWDRRNRLKIYNAIQYLLHRDIHKASKLLLDCISTFNAVEYCTYKEFIIYTILSNLLHLTRPELKRVILNGSEIITIGSEIPEIVRTILLFPKVFRVVSLTQSFLTSFIFLPLNRIRQQMKLVKSFYDCDYKAYLFAMLDVEDILRKDRFLYPHTSYWMRELHILAYKQFLDSYQSVTLQAMADAFGVSIDFIDTHASQYIASNRLSAKIDKYNGVIVSSRPDTKNAQYRDIIKKGDLLLNRIQKLARVVDL